MQEAHVVLLSHLHWFLCTNVIVAESGPAVKHALRLGILDVGDQLPTVKDVVAQLAINPNTVLKAYRELEYAGLIESRPAASGRSRPSRARSSSAPPRLCWH